MKLFCSVAMTGEVAAEVTHRMNLVVDSLSGAGHEAYCQPLDPRVDGLTTVKAMQYAFEKLADCEALVVIVTSDRKSEGMLMEVGAAMAADLPIYLFWHESTDEYSSHLPKIATKVFRWQTEKDLQNALAKL